MIDPAPALAALGLALPDPFPPAGTYVSTTRSGSLLFTAGHIPWGADGVLHTGRLGADLDLAAGIRAAQAAATSLLATLVSELGEGEEVGQILRVGGYVNATPEFTDHTQVIDGASDVLVAVFGDRGRHARLAVGVSSLPANLAVEIEATIEITTN